MNSSKRRFQFSFFFREIFRESEQKIMTEYWKSQAKKFCDFCKCWISDNKAVSFSILLITNSSNFWQRLQYVILIVCPWEFYGIFRYVLKHSNALENVRCKMDTCVIV